MITVKCKCPLARHVPENAVGKKLRCPTCGQTIRIAAAEAIPDGQGAADFDASLVINRGPTHAGDKLLLGGVADVAVGSGAGCPVILKSDNIADIQCHLVRLDFDPSRWKLQVTGNGCGVFVNGERITERELDNGDTIDIGEYELQYATGETAGVTPSLPTVAPVSHPAPPPPKPVLSRVSGNSCPSCDKPLAGNAKYCMDCGIDVKSGRPILTSQGVDEDALYEHALSLIKLISLVVWVTPLPMPIRSEAFGMRKPYAIWTIAILTVLASLAFLIAVSGPESSGDYKNLMLWAPRHFDPALVHQTVATLSNEERKALHTAYDPENKLSDEQMVAKALDAGVASEYQLASSIGIN